ncbi:response regulator [Cohnella soli]|uniref:Response regulator n=1 Tax=Cohnella soli TaxID=425005 RepID=A0ABW0HSG1_9BACL
MLNVMVVDDEQSIREGIVKILSKYPGELAVEGTYANGLDAMVRIAQMEPGELDVIITDIEMPVMDGLKFIEQAKRKMPDVSVVMLSGYNDFEYARQSMRSGAADYLLKPMDKVEVFRLLDSFALKKRAAEGEQTKTPPPSEGNGVVEQVRKLLEKEYYRPIDLPYIAKKIGFNASYISSVFSRETGETITDCLNRLRIEKAKQFLLDHPHLKVYEIAYQVGYGDKIYFQKLFKKIVGSTPVEYRERRSEG